MRSTRQSSLNNVLASFAICCLFAVFDNLTFTLRPHSQIGDVFNQMRLARQRFVAGQRMTEVGAGTACVAYM